MQFSRTLETYLRTEFTKNCTSSKGWRIWHEEIPVLYSERNKEENRKSDDRKNYKQEFCFNRKKSLFAKWTVKRRRRRPEESSAWVAGDCAIVHSGLNSEKNAVKGTDSTGFSCAVKGTVSKGFTYHSLRYKKLTLCVKVTIGWHTDGGYPQRTGTLNLCRLVLYFYKQSLGILKNSCLWEDLFANSTRCDNLGWFITLHFFQLHKEICESFILSSSTIQYLKDCFYM